MSRKNIHRAGPDPHDEVIISFRMESDKTYTKVTKVMVRDWKTGGIKSYKKNKPIEEGPYELTANVDEYDEKMDYEDYDGSMTSIYFKKVGDFKRVEVDEPDEDE
jgi:hypothetical protein